MSFFDWVEDRMDDVCFFVEQTVSFCELATDAAKDISDDFFQLCDEIVHIDDDDYVSPYQKRHNADVMIQHAEIDLREAKRNYEAHYKETAASASSAREKKKALLGRVLDKNPEDARGRDAVLFCGDMMAPSFVNKGEFSLGEGLWPLPLNYLLRDHAAESYLEDAMDYRVVANCHIEKIRSYDLKLTHIQNQLELEKKLLGQLERKIAAATKEGKAEIARSLTALLKLSICDEEGNLRRDYTEELNRLRTV